MLHKKEYPDYKYQPRRRVRKDDDAPGGKGNNGGGTEQQPAYQSIPITAFVPPASHREPAYHPTAQQLTGAGGNLATGGLPVTLTTSGLGSLGGDVKLYDYASSMSTHFASPSSSSSPAMCREDSSVSRSPPTSPPIPPIVTGPFDFASMPGTNTIGNNSSTTLTNSASSTGATGTGNTIGGGAVNPSSMIPAPFATTAGSGHHHHATPTIASETTALLNPAHSPTSRLVESATTSAAAPVYPSTAATAAAAAAAVYPMSNHCRSMTAEVFSASVMSSVESHSHHNPFLPPYQTNTSAAYPATPPTYYGDYYLPATPTVGPGLSATDAAAAAAAASAGDYINHFPSVFWRRRVAAKF